MITPKKIFSLSVSLIVILLLTLSDYALRSDPPIQGEPPRLYSNQKRDDLTHLLKDAMLRAEKSIDLIIFSLSDHELINILKKRANEGIQVNVTYDKKNSINLDRKLGSKINARPRKGIEGIMHRKILIIDGKEVWLGSTNLTHSSLEIYPNLLMGVQCQELAQDLLSSYNKYNYTIGGQNVELWMLPDPGAEKRLLQLLNSAKKTIKIAMFTWTHQKLTQAIIDAKKRGVTIEAVIDQSSTRGASKWAFECLKKGGVEPRTSLGNGLMHHKFAYIDSSLLIHGSTNWTKSAFEKNEDCFVVLHNLSKEQQTFMNSLWGIIKAESSLEN